MLLLPTNACSQAHEPFTCCTKGKPKKQQHAEAAAANRQATPLTLNGLLGGAETQADVLVPPLSTLAHNLLCGLVVAATRTTRQKRTLKLRPRVLFCRSLLPGGGERQ
jgi:hypothetical protein